MIKAARLYKSALNLRRLYIHHQNTITRRFLQLSIMVVPHPGGSGPTQVLRRQIPQKVQATTVPITSLVRRSRLVSGTNHYRIKVSPRRESRSYPALHMPPCATSILILPFS